MTISSPNPNPGLYKQAQVIHRLCSTYTRPSGQVQPGSLTVVDSYRLIYTDDVSSDYRVSYIYILAALSCPKHYAARDIWLRSIRVLKLW